MRTVLWPGGLLLMALACPALAQDGESETVTYDCLGDEGLEGELIRPTAANLFGRELLAAIEVPPGGPEDLERREVWIDRKLRRRAPEYRAQVMANMGDRTWAAADRVFADGMEAVDALWAAGEDSLGESLAVDAEYSAALAVALKWYERAAEEPVPGDLAGKVQLRLAWVLFELDREGEALAALGTLVKSDAGHRERTHAMVLFGDHYFTLNNAYAAARAYEEVFQSDETALARYAGYKLAWCRYNLGEFSVAADTVLTMIERCAADPTADALLAEARMDLVLMAAEMGTVEEAMAAIRRSCLDDSGCEAAGFDRLQSWYDNIGKLEEAAEVRGDQSQ